MIYFNYMTEKAVNEFIGRAVVSDEFRKKLLGLKMTREEITAVDPDLDSQDVNAIFTTLLLIDPVDLSSFSAGIGNYIDRRYRNAGPSGLSGPSGDDLPISV